MKLSAGDASSTTAVAGDALLPMTYNGGSDRFDPPGDVTPRMIADEAYAAWDATQDPPEPHTDHEAFFALLTAYGRGHMLDNGLRRAS